MKKTILKIGKAITKAEQKNINGGMGNDICGCTNVYSNVPGEYIDPLECQFLPSGGFGLPFLCYGMVKNGMCCVA